MEQRISDYFVQHLVRDPPPQVRYDYCSQRGLLLYLFCPLRVF